MFELQHITFDLKMIFLTICQNCKLASPAEFMNGVENSDIMIYVTANMHCEDKNNAIAGEIFLLC